MACSTAACPRTLQLWYDAYCEFARELNGPRSLAHVILFGSRESSLAVRVVEGDTEVSVAIGGVVISTPDHTHFHPAWWAMERGKHVYLEKPSRMRSMRCAA